MKVPHAELVVVEREKVCAYVLNAEHRHGASKATFFSEFGFTSESRQLLAQALREHGRRHDVSGKKEAGFGPRYVVDGELTTPEGRRPRVRTVWQIDHRQTAPRLITAHPREEEP